MTHRNIPIRVDHLGTSDRLEAAVWCLLEFGIEHVDILRPITVDDNTDLAACFWFDNQRDANWFALRWL